MADVKALYDEDFVAWSEQQAEALRAAARGGSNHQLDWENLAEEIESLGKSDRRELASRLAVIVEHLIKLDHSPARYPRKRWRQTILRERGEIERILDDSPSLRREVPKLIRNEAKRAAEIALGELDIRRELGQGLRETLKRKNSLELFSYTPDQILGDWFPPEPKG